MRIYIMTGPGRLAHAESFPPRVLSFPATEQGRASAHSWAEGLPIYALIPAKDSREARAKAGGK